MQRKTKCYWGVQLGGVGGGDCETELINQRQHVDETGDCCLRISVGHSPPPRPLLQQTEWPSFYAMTELLTEGLDVWHHESKRTTTKPTVQNWLHVMCTTIDLQSRLQALHYQRLPRTCPIRCPKKVMCYTSCAQQHPVNSVWSIAT